MLINGVEDLLSLEIKEFKVSSVGGFHYPALSVGEDMVVNGGLL